MGLNRYEYKPDYPVMPGLTLKETMEYLNISLKELSVRTGITEQSINRIMNGKQPITPETANKLELVTGLTAQFWNNMETQYRDLLIKKREREMSESNSDWLKQIPVKELIKRGIIRKIEDQTELFREVLSFFRVSSVEAWDGIWRNPQIATRRSECFQTNIGYAATWIRLGELEAEKIETKSYNETAFKDVLKQIRAMTYDLPEDFAQKIKDMSADCGVAVAFIPEMPKVPWNGAAKWLSPDKALLILNLRGKKDDKFWFSLFHEACHILKHSKKKLFITGSENDKDESDADKFAADFLIPFSYNERITNAVLGAEIVEIANELQISPGIVAGRYQFLTKNWKKFNDLKKKLHWKKIN